MIENAFTCTGAYAVLIASGFKHVENRSAMPVPTCGRCAMSVSKKFCKAEYDKLCDWLRQQAGNDAVKALVPWETCQKWPGCIIATMDYDAIDLLPDSGFMLKQCLQWNEGYPFWWQLDNIRLLQEPIPCRGNVGMWKLPQELAAAIQATDTTMICRKS